MQKRKNNHNRIHLVIKRDGGYCRACGTNQNLTVDHIVPLATGGYDKLDNLQILCRNCNLAKGTKTILYPKVAK